MLPLRYARSWRVAGVALLFFVLAATLLPVGWLFKGAGSIDWLKHVDKLAHALTFLVLALWFAGQYRSFWGIAIGLLAFGAVIELCQMTVGYRSADWLDVAANAAGIMVGLGIAATGLVGWCQRAEAWYIARNA